MKHVIVYGTSCCNCNATMELFKTVAAENQFDIELTKESSAEAIMLAGIMSTPSVAIDNKVVHSGSVPSQEQIKAWLQG